MAVFRRIINALQKSLRLVLPAALVCLGLAAPIQAQNRQPVDVAAGLEQGFGRLVLTFRDRLSLPAYAINLDNNVLTIGFSSPVEASLPELGEVLAAYASVARVDPDGMGLRIGLKGAIRVNHIEAGERLFIDFLPAGWQGLPPGLPDEVVRQLAQRAEQAAYLADQRRRAEMARLTAPAVDMRIGQHPTFTRLEFTWSLDTRASFSREGDVATLEFEWPVELPILPLRMDLPSDILSVENRVTPEGSTLTLTLSPATVARFYQESPTEIVLDLDFTDAPGRATALTELVDAPPAPIVQAAAEISEARGTAPTESHQTEITPFVNLIGDTVRLVFPFDQDTPAAVFNRAGTVWMLFDTHVRINDLGDNPALDAISLGLDIESQQDLQIVRIDMLEDRLATLGSEGRAWVLSLGDILFTPTEPVELERQRAESGRLRVVADMNRPARVHAVRDPNVGDIIEVVTAYPPARGIVRNLDFVDFQALQAVHGLVLRPLRPEVTIGIEGEYVVIDATDGLSISRLGETRLADTPVDAASRSTFIDLGAYERHDVAELVEDRDEMLERAVTTEGALRDAARLVLAQFFLANQLAPEAIGVLTVMQKQQPSAEFAERLALTTAAADVLARRPDEALEILMQDRLVDALDAAMWRTIARAQKGQWTEARAESLLGEGTIVNYPAWLQNRFLFAAMRAAVETRDVDLALRLSGGFDIDNLSDEERSSVQLLNARIDEIEGRLDDALRSYALIVAGDHRTTKSEAVFRTLEVMDAQGRLDPAEAAATLQREAMTWRGDLLEADMQGMLGSLYFRAEEFRPGFEVMAQGQRVHQATAPIEALYEEAQTVFAGLFIDGQADKLDPIAALGIFYDFRNLAPVGPRGDEMIRNLARRLIKVDLLDQAAGLLEYQVDNRLEGAARAQIAADLAVIRIANREPNAALDVLNRTRIQSLAPTLERQRRVLEAKALIEAGRDELALEVLRNMQGRDVMLLSVEAHWAGKRYREAGELIEAWHGLDPNAPLTVSVRNDLVRAAVAYALANDEIGLSRLRLKYSEPMAMSPEWPLFDFVTSKVDPTTLRFREIVTQLAGIDTLDNFLAAYSRSYGTEGSVLPATARPVGV